MDSEQISILKTFPNTKCSFCSMEIPEAEGIVLQLCLHSYCRPCLSSSVEQQILDGKNQLKCYFIDESAASASAPHTECNKIILDIEIKEVVSKSMYDRYTNGELYKAQDQLNQLQKCYNPSCNNFVWIEDKETENSFRCPHCNSQNCLKCQVHFGNNTERDFCSCVAKRPRLNAASGDAGTNDHDPEEWKKIWDQLRSNTERRKSILVTQDEFECPICLSDVSPGDGVMLSVCFHSFHRECLAKTIEMSESVQVKCPFVKGTNLCQSLILDREIMAIVSKEVLDKHLTKSVVAAELGCKNSFHCFTIDCNGWCEVAANDLEFFRCPVCKKKNCIKCETIHENMSCHEYKIKLNLWKSDDKTRATMEALIKKKEAKPCPQCRVLIIKDGGCDHMKCTVCNTDFSWAKADIPITASSNVAAPHATGPVFPRGSLFPPGPLFPPFPFQSSFPVFPRR